jgi:hypothetical protein
MSQSVSMSQTVRTVQIRKEPDDSKFEDRQKQNRTERTDKEKKKRESTQRIESWHHLLAYRGVVVVLADCRCALVATTT